MVALRYGRYAATVMGIPGLSTSGLVAAAIYAVIAIAIVRHDRVHPNGGWINLNGMASNLITLPVSLAGEWLGLKPDYRRNVDMFVTITLCALLVYGVTTGVAAGIHALLSKPGAA